MDSISFILYHTLVLGGLAKMEFTLLIQNEFENKNQF